MGTRCLNLAVVHSEDHKDKTCPTLSHCFWWRPVSLGSVWPMPLISYGWLFVFFFLSVYYLSSLRTIPEMEFRTHSRTKIISSLDLKLIIATNNTVANKVTALSPK